ncbi:MAG: carbohydrate ABC transporter permease [Treponema sp.]|jgi:raffinose/stachyose/melibiose transport system permease protein|nr:carbohydrate ABC transporter permease [Treponema sp.]MBQ1713630.1 carbohydrate ABC transporter permease [Treponema sp.]MBQ1795083.1 carbohydrate ABC transporter permease [Treponema sp.]MBQ2354822.1 carbohydrate ABC transporter permease [Treponema sp.]MBQ5450457.1 carbohydrate ABC transporter permease [Treponema sp.]
MKYSHTRQTEKTIIFCFLVLLSAIFLVPVFLVFMNSFKSKLYISSSPFSLPARETFVGMQNYINGITSSGFFLAFLRSVFITVASLALIVVCTSMTSWFIVRVKNKFTRSLYYLFAFSMIVPFQMVMFTMTYIVNKMNFDNVFGITLVYLGFGAGLSVFMFAGFVKAVPAEMEEAAEIDGCNPLQTFFLVVFPVLKPTAITVAILNAMWVWNDYLLPYLVLGTDNKTVPVAIQIAMQGAYGATDYGGFMAMLVVAIIPIIAFYISAQKYIIKGVISGAVKG